MATTRDQAYEALASLHPAPVFLQSYSAKQLPENLEIYFGPPEELFIAPDTQEVCTRGRLIPILDDGNFGLVTFLDPDTRELVQLDVESPEDTRTCFKHWQQYLADLLLRIADVDDDEQVRRIAAIVGFEHTDKLFEFLERAESLDGDAWWEARARFPLSIP